jgi:hypothetical protein
MGGFDESDGSSILSLRLCDLSVGVPFAISPLHSRLIWILPRLRIVSYLLLGVMACILLGHEMSTSLSTRMNAYEYDSYD